MDGTDASPHVLVLNGGSSSGKSTLARALQRVLPGTWLRLGVDTLIEACPPGLLSGAGLSITDGGEVAVGKAFAEVEWAWMQGVAAMASAGARVLVEDNFLSGALGQDRWRRALGTVPTGWVGVRCDAAAASERERSRGDRVAGMAARQADAVHKGVEYDLEVDTASSTPEALAELVRSCWFRELR